MSKTEAYKTLGIEVGATEQEIHQAWLDLLFVWHPDRYNGNHRLRTLMEEKTKEINEAYERIKEGRYERREEDELREKITRLEKLIRGAASQLLSPDQISENFPLENIEKLASQRMELITLNDKLIGLYKKVVRRTMNQYLRLRRLHPKLHNVQVDHPEEHLEEIARLTVNALIKLKTILESDENLYFDHLEKLLKKLARLTMDTLMNNLE